MKINEVERLTGITKKNIRFYEEQKLFSPHRNTENGYRLYSEEDVEILLRIKLFRKIGVPIEEIRQMIQMTHTVGDGMRRHLVTLEREKTNLEYSLSICRELKEQEIFIGDLDARQILDDMEKMEQGGAHFQNKQKDDVRVQYIAPVGITTFFLISIGLTVFALIWGYRLPTEETPPIAVAIIILFLLACVGVGIVTALMQRIREINRGEVDDAKKY